MSEAQDRMKVRARQWLDTQDAKESSYWSISGEHTSYPARRKEGEGWESAWVDVSLHDGHNTVNWSLDVEDLDEARRTLEGLETFVVQAKASFQSLVESVQRAEAEAKLEAGDGD